MGEKAIPRREVDRLDDSLFSRKEGIQPAQACIGGREALHGRGKASSLSSSRREEAQKGD